MLARALLRREAGRIILLRSLRSRVRSARGEVEGKLPEGGEYGAGTWRRSRIMEVDGRSGSQDGAQPPPRMAATAVSSAPSNRGTFSAAEISVAAA